MEVGEEFGGGGVFYGLILGLLVFVDGKVIAVFHDLGFGDEEGFCGAGVILFITRGRIATASVRTGFAMTNYRLHQNLVIARERSDRGNPHPQTIRVPFSMSKPKEVSST